MTVHRPGGILRRANTGMTLLELVVVIALLGIVFSATIPRLLDTGAVRCIHAGRTLASFLRYAQIHAMQTGIPVSAGFEGDGLTTFFLRDDQGRPVIEERAGALPGRTSGPGRLPWDLSQDVEQVTTDLVNAELRYHPDLGTPEEGEEGSRQPLAEVRTVTLRNGVHEVRILVYPDTGFVRVEQ